MSANGSSCEQPHALGQIVEAAAQVGASDIHIRSGAPPLYRVDGLLSSSPFPPMSAADVEAALFACEAPGRAGYAVGTKELDLARMIAGRRCRINLFRDRAGPGAVIRLLPAEIPELAALGLPPVAEEISRRQRGFVLIAGPAGAGKSTTLAALADRISRTRPVHIITIEDPVESVLCAGKGLISQREVGSDTGSFPAALRAALRQDPDVIVIGELRDPETIELALTAAETGHLVLATIHSGSSTQAVSRMIDAFPLGKRELMRCMVADALECVIGQRLERAGSGGRVVVAEVLIATPAVRSLIREGKLHQLGGVMQSSMGVGMITFEQRIRQLQGEGVLPVEETPVRRAAFGHHSAAPPVRNGAQ